MNKTKMVFAAIGVIAALAIIGVAGWQFGWWLQEKNVNRQVQIDNRNKGVQTAWMDEARNAIEDYNLIDPSNTAARGAVRIKACTLIERLVGPYRQDDLVKFQEEHC